MRLSAALRRRSTLRPRTEPAGRSWPWAVLGGVLGLLLAAAVWAPARWLASALHSATGGHLQLVHPRGTVWNGSAGVVLASGPGGADALSLPGRLAWQLRPRLDGLAGALDLPCCASQPQGFALRHADGGLRLDWQDGATRWPAAMLSGLGAPWNTLRLEGTLDLRTQGLRVNVHNGRLRLDGGATLDATDIASRLSTLRPLGSYRLALNGGEAPSVLLSTQAGALQLAGSGLWNGATLRFSGEAHAAPGSEDALANLLNIIGRRQGARSIISIG